MLTKWYEKVLTLASHRHATYFLAIVSFVESFIFPVPPYVMLFPMIIARPKCACRYASVATVFSVLGGVFGYYLGFVWANYMLHMIYKIGYYNYYLSLQQMITKWGFIAVILSAITPIPYKVFTISSGLLKFNLFRFIMGSIIGRSLRFFVISILLQKHGIMLDKFIRDFLKLYGRIFVVFIITLIFSYILYKIL